MSYNKYVGNGNVRPYTVNINVENHINQKIFPDSPFKCILLFFRKALFFPYSNNIDCYNVLLGLRAMTYGHHFSQI